MYKLTQQHPQFKEIITLGTFDTPTECKECIVLTAGLSGVDMNNIDDYELQNLHTTTKSYKLSGSFYMIDKVGDEAVTMPYAGSDYEVVPQE
jgi:hypothetical protein